MCTIAFRTLEWPSPRSRCGPMYSTLLQGHVQGVNGSLCLEKMIQKYKRFGCYSFIFGKNHDTQNFSVFFILSNLLYFSPSKFKPIRQEKWFQLAFILESMHTNFCQIRTNFSRKISYPFPCTLSFFQFRKKHLSHTEFQIWIEHDIFVFLKTYRAEFTILAARYVFGFLNFRFSIQIWNSV